MDVMTVVLSGALLAVFTAIHTWVSKGRFDKQDRRIDRLEARIDRRIDGLEERMERRFEQVGGELTAIRSDLTQIALALGLRARPETG